ncbi:hypothetical protein Hanom_Chr01g00094811 [Helianthus anomalus]
MFTTQKYIYIYIYKLGQICIYLYNGIGQFLRKQMSFKVCLVKVWLPFFFFPFSSFSFSLAAAAASVSFIFKAARALRAANFCAIFFWGF